MKAQSKKQEAIITDLEAQTKLITDKSENELSNMETYYEKVPFIYIYLYRHSYI